MPLSGPAAAAWGKMPPNSCCEITHIGRHTKQKIDHAGDKQAAGEEARSEIETRRPTIRAGMSSRASKNLQSHGVARPARSRTALKIPKGQSLSRLPRFDTGRAPGPWHTRAQTKLPRRRACPRLRSDDFVYCCA